jgi:hypothetical protein
MRNLETVVVQLLVSRSLPSSGLTWGVSFSLFFSSSRTIRHYITWATDGIVMQTKQGWSVMPWSLSTLFMRKCFREVDRHTSPSIGLGYWFPVTNIMRSSPAFVSFIVYFLTHYRAGIATGYRLNGRGVGIWVRVAVRFFRSPRLLDWFWGPPSLISNW